MTYVIVGVTCFAIGGIFGVWLRQIVAHDEWKREQGKR